MTPPLVIVITELRGARYSARLEDGTELCRLTRQPLLDSARELLKRGCDLATPLVMRREGASGEALRSTVDAAAKLTVLEEPSRPRFSQWKPFQPWDGWAQTAQNAGVAPMPEKRLYRGTEREKRRPPTSFGAPKSKRMRAPPPSLIRGRAGCAAVSWAHAGRAPVSRVVGGRAAQSARLSSTTRKAAGGGARMRPARRRRSTDR
jgi:hypothetical protein